MLTKGTAPSEGAAPNGLAEIRSELPSSRNGFGSERVVEIQRARMLAAMVEVCVERGAANVTVAHVVERAGVSRRTFYEVFTDREDCFLAAFDEAVAQASGYVLDSYDPQAKWAERVRSALTALLRFLDVQRGAGQLLIVGSLGAGAKALERRKRVLAQMITVIDQGRTESKAGQELPPLTAEGITGGVLAVLHARLIDTPHPSDTRDARIGDTAGDSLLKLTGPLMSMIVLPYQGVAAARKELARPVSRKPTHEHVPRANAGPLMQLEMRLTYRTVRVLMAIAAHPGSSNRMVADTAEVTDQGQMSKLLARLQSIGLIENNGAGAIRGEPNAWTLTHKGWQVQNAIAEQTTRS